ncbi:hypothetical protein Q3G72_027608 [Acer saccharum]|nr:hypothetical protein Q3G72_027608 [Acer saccharum]
MLLFSLPECLPSRVSPDENVTVLKINLSCDDCNRTLKKILKVNGLEMVAMDMEKDLVTLKGTVSMTELRSYIKRDFKVVVPAKKDIDPTEKKGRETGANGKKETDAGAVDKKGKEVGVVEMIIREKETEPTYKKSKGKDAGAIDKKGKEVGAKKIKDRDSEPKGSAGMDNKTENKDCVVNLKKDRDDGHRKNEEASSDGDQFTLYSHRKIEKASSDGDQFTLYSHRKIDEASSDGDQFTLYLIIVIVFILFIVSR